jgi:predicted SprT family Zn-dependent metalloprotease
MPARLLSGLGRIPVATHKLDHLLPRLIEVRQLALELLATYGLADWTFAYNRRKRALGFCFYASRTIELSIHFVEHNDADSIRDTLLHEIAHALVGPGHAHDTVWKAMCRRIGAQPQACCRSARMPEGNWQAQCGSCGRRYTRYRKPKRLDGWYCPPCHHGRGNLIWHRV